MKLNFSNFDLFWYLLLSDSMSRHDRIICYASRPTIIVFTVLPLLVSCLYVGKKIGDGFTVSEKKDVCERSGLNMLLPFHSSIKGDNGIMA